MNHPRAGVNPNSEVSLANEDGVKQILTQTIFDLWAAVNQLTRLRPSKVERYRVSIFGSPG